MAAIDEPVDFMVIAGDVYDGDWKDFNTGLFFVRQIESIILMAKIGAVRMLPTPKNSISFQMYFSILNFSTLGR